MLLHALRMERTRLKQRKYSLRAEDDKKDNVKHIIITHSLEEAINVFAGFLAKRN